MPKPEIIEKDEDGYIVRVEPQGGKKIEIKKEQKLEGLHIALNPTGNVKDKTIHFLVCTNKKAGELLNIPMADFKSAVKKKIPKDWKGTLTYVKRTGGSYVAAKLKKALLGQLGIFLEVCQKHQEFQ